MEEKSDGYHAGINQNTSLKATRLSFRRSFESSAPKDVSNISKKKSRRSSGRRKSLVEALHSIHNLSSTVANTNNMDAELSERQSETGSDSQSSKFTSDATDSQESSNVCSQPIVAQPILECMDDLPHTKFVLDYNKALTKELQEWKSVHEEYKLKEKEAKASHIIVSEMQSLIDQSTDLNQKSYDTYREKFTELEQRYSVAVRSIKASLEQMKNLRMSQENWINQKMETEVQKIQQYSDPQMLFEKICTYNDLLLGSSLKRSCTV